MSILSHIWSTLEADTSAWRLHAFESRSNLTAKGFPAVINTYLLLVASIAGVHLPHIARKPSRFSAGNRSSHVADLWWPQKVHLFSAEQARIRSAPCAALSINMSLSIFWPEFEAKLPDLFITEASNCQVEIIEIVSSSNFSPPHAVKGERIESDGKRNLVERISSVEELDTVLHVRGHTSKATFVFSNSNNLIIHRENYSRVLQGYCRRLFQ